MFVIRTVPVIDDINRTVRRLEAVRIRNRGPFIQEESTQPGLAVIFGQIGCEMAPSDAVIDLSVLNQQQIA
jgi:hypothetical protein